MKSKNKKKKSEKRSKIKEKTPIKCEKCEITFFSKYTLLFHMLTFIMKGANFVINILGFLLKSNYILKAANFQ